MVQGNAPYQQQSAAHTQPALPSETEGHAQRVVGAQGDATPHSAAGAQEVAVAARERTVKGTTVQCA